MRPNNESPDLSALATHMRTAAGMLAQLEASGSKRPKSEVAAIQARIIASMQTLEEQSFFFEETAPIPTFDTIMASTTYGNRGEGGDAQPKAAINSEAGAARMENDQMTSGVERKADYDDPSAATFGEEWTAKRERVRKSSPYGMCPNWNLLSVIVKTGADLRQEAFACQLIRVCGKIWERASVPVWIKRMRILVTGEVSYCPLSLVCVAMLTPSAVVRIDRNHHQRHFSALTQALTHDCLDCLWQEPTRPNRHAQRPLYQGFWCRRHGRV